MNRVDRSDRFVREGRSLVSDPVRTAPPAPPVALDLSDDDFVPKGLRAWAGRFENGLYVQGLVDADGTTFISAGIPGRDLHQTWEVARVDAADAFEHPFAHGCTLPL
jgi:hypothetical protein